MHTISANQAAHLLRTVSQEWQTFRFAHGVTARSMKELAEALHDMNEIEFRNHVGAVNEFAMWVELVCGDKRLAAKMRLLATLKATCNAVMDRVTELTALLPAEPTVEQKARENDIALANAARNRTLTLPELEMAVAAPAPTPAKASAKRGTARAAAKSGSASKSHARKPSAKAKTRLMQQLDAQPEEPKKKASIFARLLGWN